MYENNLNTIWDNSQVNFIVEESSYFALCWMGVKSTRSGFTEIEMLIMNMSLTKYLQYIIGVVTYAEMKCW